jgi:arylsulfatase A-like enzyme
MSAPNVVVIYADDLGWGDLGCFGGEDMRTPVLDRLAESGVRLSQWYSNSPVCSPSRASLMTGRYPAHAGVMSILGGSRHTVGLPHQGTIAEELGRRGYRTGIFGKWHLGAAHEYRPSRFGFDESFGFRAGCVDYYSHIYYWANHNPVHDLWEDDQEIWQNGEYLTTVIGERAARFIAENANRPFFAYVPFNAPHYPMHAPAEYVERFAHLPQDRRIMAAMIAAMDDAIGVILDALDAHGLRENTVVFFSSDNGPSRESRNWLDGEEVSYHGGSAGGLRGSKGSLFEGGIRVPAIISWPGMLPAGAVHDAPAVMMDIPPTLLEAVDGRPPEGDAFDGVSQLGAIRTAGGREAGPVAGERDLFWTHDGQWAVRRGALKLVESPQEGMTPPAVLGRALFDLESDPGEQTDLSEHMPDVVAELAQELSGFRARSDGWQRGWEVRSSVG